MRQVSTIFRRLYQQLSQKLSARSTLSRRKGLMRGRSQHRLTLMLIGFLSIYLALLQSLAKAQPHTTSRAATNSQPIAATAQFDLDSLPLCNVVYDKFPDYKSQPPDDYPAMHFDRQQLINTMLEIAHNPKIGSEQLAQIFGLRFINCKDYQSTPEGKPQRYTVWMLSDGGYPLKPVRSKYEAAVTISHYMNHENRYEDSRVISFYFDFKSNQPNQRPKIDATNCVLESDFEQILKDDWQLSVIYHHVGWKHYTKQIDGSTVQFRAKPYRFPRPSNPMLIEGWNRRLCVERITISIENLERK